jgi:hypothetical protein
MGAWDVGPSGGNSCRQSGKVGTPVSVRAKVISPEDTLIVIKLYLPQVSPSPAPVSNLKMDFRTGLPPCVRLQSTA